MKEHHMMYTRRKSALVAVAGAAALILLNTGSALAQGAGATAGRTRPAGKGDPSTTSLPARNSGMGVATGPGPQQANTALDAQTVPATTATPEPWTYGLMLLGMGAISWLKRHRQAP
jgi:hypothetical protein